jgi:hypothetical protein
MYFVILKWINKDPSSLSLVVSFTYFVYGTPRILFSYLRFGPTSPSRERFPFGETISNAKYE